MRTPQDPSPDEPTRPLNSGWGDPTDPNWGRPSDSAGQSQWPYDAPPPYNGPVYPPMPIPPPQHPKAMTAMGLGIFSLLGGFTCYLPILAGPFAWAVGRSTVREIDAEPSRWSGREMANAGHIMGIVASVLLILALVAVVVGVVLLVNIA